MEVVRKKPNTKDSLPESELRGSNGDAHINDSVSQVRKAILNDAIMTKDLEEQMDNVNLAEKIARRPSVDHEDSNIKSKCNLSISAISPRLNPVIEPIPTSVGAGRSGRKSRSPHRRRTVDESDPGCSPRTNGSGKSEIDDDMQSKITDSVGSRGGAARMVEPGVGPSKLGRYQSLMTDVDPMKRTRGSLTPSSDSDGERPPVSYETANPLVFSASGATVTSFATQTPEEMNSSDSDHTDDEPAKDPVPSRKLTTSSSSSDSTGESSSETEEWDSEADTHTSASDNDANTLKQPVAHFYPVVDVPKVPLPDFRGRKTDRPAPPMPWMRRPTFASMQFPTSVTSHPPPPRRASTTSLPASHSLPQDFLRMVSNPFLSTSLHEAYRHACSFKEWYEANFLGLAGLQHDEPGAARTTSSAPIHQFALNRNAMPTTAPRPASSQPRRLSGGTRNLTPKMHAQV